jgi:hypothetical protein
MGVTDNPPAFDLADLDWMKAQLHSVRLPPPKPVLSAKEVEQGRCRLNRWLAKRDLPLSPPWVPSKEPVDPLKELGQYYLEVCRRRRRDNRQPLSELQFWTNYILFTGPWHLGADFPLTVARHCAVALYYRRVEWKLREDFLTQAEAEAARNAAAAGSDVDARQDKPPLDGPPDKPTQNAPRQRYTRSKQARRRKYTIDVLRKKFGDSGPPWLLSRAQAETIPSIITENLTAFPSDGDDNTKRRFFSACIKELTEVRIDS